MANTAGVCNSFKSEILTATHDLTTSTGDTLGAALFQTTASIGPATTAYSTTGEVSSAGYTAGGVTVTNGTSPSTSGSTGIWTPTASFSWTGVSFTTDCCLIYNKTKSNKAIESLTFSSQTVTAGTFTLTMPTNDASNALLRIG